jgi:hypothetical protein
MEENLFERSLRKGVICDSDNILLLFNLIEHCREFFDWTNIKGTTSFHWKRKSEENNTLSVSKEPDGAREHPKNVVCMDVWMYVCMCRYGYEWKMMKMRLVSRILAFGKRR